MLTYRIELVHSLHVMLNEHDIVDGLLQFKGILLTTTQVTQGVIKSGHDRWKTIVATNIAETTTQGANKAWKAVFEKDISIKFKFKDPGFLLVLSIKKN